MRLISYLPSAPPAPTANTMAAPKSNSAAVKIQPYITDSAFVSPVSDKAPGAVQHLHLDAITHQRFQGARQPTPLVELEEGDLQRLFTQRKAPTRKTKTRKPRGLIMGELPRLFASRPIGPTTFPFAYGTLAHLFAARPAGYQPHLGALPILFKLRRAAPRLHDLNRGELALLFAARTHCDLKLGTLPILFASHADIPLGYWHLLGQNDLTHLFSIRAASSYDPALGVLARQFHQSHVKKGLIDFNHNELVHFFSIKAPSVVEPKLGALAVLMRQPRVKTAPAQLSPNELGHWFARLAKPLCAPHIGDLPLLFKQHRQSSYSFELRNELAHLFSRKVTAVYDPESGMLSALFSGAEQFYANARVIPTVNVLRQPPYELAPEDLAALYAPAPTGDFGPHSLYLDRYDLTRLFSKSAQAAYTPQKGILSALFRQPRAQKSGVADLGACYLAQLFSRTGQSQLILATGVLPLLFKRSSKQSNDAVLDGSLPQLFSRRSFAQVHFGVLPALFKLQRASRTGLILTNVQPTDFVHLFSIRARPQEVSRGILPVLFKQPRAINAEYELCRGDLALLFASQNSYRLEHGVLPVIFKQARKNAQQVHQGDLPRLFSLKPVYEPQPGVLPTLFKSSRPIHASLVLSRHDMFNLFARRQPSEKLIVGVLPALFSRPSAKKGLNLNGGDLNRLFSLKPKQGYEISNGALRVLFGPPGSKTTGFSLKEGDLDSLFFERVKVKFADAPVLFSIKAAAI